MEFSWRDELFADIAHQLEVFGWSVVYVGGSCSVPGCPGDHDSDLVALGLPAYGYTVGMPLRFDHAELVVVGLDREGSSCLLNIVGQAVAHGARLKPGDVLDVGGMPLKVGTCAPSHLREGLVAVSIEYHRAIGHPSTPDPVQIMWPDANGRFPGEPRLDRRARRAQPQLSRARPRR